MGHWDPGDLAYRMKIFQDRHLTYALVWMLFSILNPLSAAFSCKFEWVKLWPDSPNLLKFSPTIVLHYMVYSGIPYLSVDILPQLFPLKDAHQNVAIFYIHIMVMTEKMVGLSQEINRLTF